MTWTQVALGVFVGSAAWAAVSRIAWVLFAIRARNSTTLQRWIEESERADRPVRAAFRRGQG